jgi:hypothetical protein
MVPQNIATISTLCTPLKLFAALAMAFSLVTISPPSNGGPLNGSSQDFYASNSTCKMILQGESPREVRPARTQKPTVLAIFSPDEAFLTRSNSRRNSQRIYFGNSEQAVELTRTFDPNDHTSHSKIAELFGESFAQAMEQLEQRGKGFSRYWVRIEDVWPSAFPNFDRFEVARLAVNIDVSESDSANIVATDLRLMNPGDTEGRSVEVPTPLLESLNSLARVQMKLTQHRNSQQSEMGTKIRANIFFVEVLVGHFNSIED